jgi:phosphate transport system permease protein
VSLSIAFIAILLVAVMAGLFAFKRAKGLRRGGERLNSLPVYHAIHTAIWAAAPAILLLMIWTPIQNNLVDQAVLASPAGQALPDFAMQRDAILGEAREIALGQREAGFNPESTTLAPVYRAAMSRYALAGGLAAIVLALAGAFFALRRQGVQFRARTAVERWVMGLLVGASLIAILTTLGIVLSLLFESLLFFSKVNVGEFLFGTTWSPQTAIRADQAGSSGAFGSVPLFWGTIFIGAIIAMIVAIPLGLMCAIFLTQYAHQKVRAWLKPILEILAGVPTVVYGYFAALTVAPMIRDFGIAIGVSSASSESALAAGLVMGIMIIPFVSSMADDSIAAVPQAMRDGSLALGATRSETIKKVILPAALPGVVGGVLLAVSRAIGETMIVVMAAGLAANLTINPFESVTTVTTQIVQLLTGDQEFDSVHRRISASSRAG